MSVGESKQADYGTVLLQIVQRLRDILKPANESTCFLSLDPDDLPSNPGDHVFVVAPVSGKFDRGAFVGASIAGLTTHAGCIVKIHCASLIDQEGRDAIAITDESLGLIKQASAVISALAPTTADMIAQAGWVPTLNGYNLTSPFTPVGYSLHKNDTGAVRSIELTFEFEFDWDTTQQ